MMSISTAAERGKSQSRSEAYSSGAVVMVIATAVILAALAYEYIGGYLPCPLCLQQRYAYYVGIPLTFLALVMVSGGNARIAGLVFFAVSLAFLANTGLGVYHAGIEWAFWPGPASCGTLQSLEGLGGSLNDVNVIKCDEAQWRFAGLSFAGWNAVVSAGLAILALKAAFNAAPSA